MRIEVRVEDYNSIRAPEVDADAPSTSGQKIDEDVGIGLVELVHAFLSIGLLGIAVLTCLSEHNILQSYDRSKYSRDGDT